MHYKCGKTFLGRPTVLRSTSGPCSIKFGSESPTFVRNSCRRTEQPTWRQYPLEAHNPPCSKTPTKFQLTARLSLQPRDASTQRSGPLCEQYLRIAVIVLTRTRTWKNDESTYRYSVYFTDWRY